MQIVPFRSIQFMNENNNNNKIVVVALYLNAEAAASSETSVSAYQSTCHDISEDSHVYSHLRTNIKSYSSKEV